MPKKKRSPTPSRRKATSRRRAADAIESFHAHVYYDSPTRAQAVRLCRAAERTFGIKVGRMHDNPVGPHPRGSCQLTVPKSRFAAVMPWLVLNRGGLTVFAHAQTGDSLKDHTRHVIWLGPSETLDLTAFEAR
jgi:DOPA 4,5-dioxygenase